MEMILLVAVTEQAGQVIQSFPVEQVFGGGVLVLLIWLLLTGKIRTEREVEREKEINVLQKEAIDTQRKTIKALTEKDRETLNLLRELRTAAISRGDLHFSDMMKEEVHDD